MPCAQGQAGQGQAHQGAGRRFGHPVARTGLRRAGWREGDQVCAVALYKRCAMRPLTAASPLAAASQSWASVHWVAVAPRSRQKLPSGRWRPACVIVEPSAASAAAIA